LAVIVWIVNPYGSLPQEAWQEYRSSMLARALARAGHQAVWWISNFEHRSKTFRSPTWQRRELDDGTSVIVVPTTPYHGHISLPRIRSERVFARRVVEQAAREPKPDVVVLAEPALFFGPRVVRWCRESGVRLVVDVLDLWPELFSVALPHGIRSFDRAIFWPLYRRRRQLLRSADGIVTVCRDYLVPVAVAQATCPTEVCYLGVPPQTDHTVRQADETNVPEIPLPSKAEGDVWFVYAGTFGEAYDLATVARAVEKLVESGARCRFIFAGAGPLRQVVEDLAAAHPGCVHFLGTITPVQLRRVYESCDVGICSYSPGSTVAMPVKLYDYLAAGLAIVNSLGRECGALVESSGCGINYVAGDSDSLFAALVRCMNRPEERDHGRRVAKRLSADLGSDMQHDRFVRFIEKVVLGSAPQH